VPPSNDLLTLASEYPFGASESLFGCEKRDAKKPTPLPGRGIAVKASPKRYRIHLRLSGAPPARQGMVPDAADSVVAKLGWQDLQQSAQTRKLT
jgi:hypothetical protein